MALKLLEMWKYSGEVMIEKKKTDEDAERGDFIIIGRQRRAGKMAKSSASAVCHKRN